VVGLESNVLLLNNITALANLMSNPGELDRRVRFDDPQKILLEECVEQCREMRTDEGILLEF
jgi:hypothetical protein